MLIFLCALLLIFLPKNGIGGIISLLFYFIYNIFHSLRKLKKIIISNDKITLKYMKKEITYPINKLKITYKKNQAGQK